MCSSAGDVLVREMRACGRGTRREGVVLAVEVFYDDIKRQFPAHREMPLHHYCNICVTQQEVETLARGAAV